MKTLVTGGAGFIGSHICQKLLAREHQVIAVDNLASGRLENIEELLNIGVGFLPCSKSLSELSLSDGL